jgi:hypothetical protein
MAKRVPYAVANYEKIVAEDFYFVDKTRFIRELETYQIPVFLRPRRFGKSLWCSVLECYYDINRKDRFEELFGNTHIGQEPTGQQNSHLVMRFDFSKIVVSDNLVGIEDSFTRTCSKAMSVFAAQNPDYGFEAALTEPTAAGALEAVLAQARSKNAPTLCIIIDEYDNFTNQLLTTHQDELYGEVTTGDSFLRAFFKTIKAGVGEGSVGRVFITGVLPVTMDDLTSGFNIGQIITLEEHTLEMMGFTQAEMDEYVDTLFTEQGWDGEKRETVRGELKSHYDGYQLLPGAEPLYNSTIANFYLNKLVINKGKIPTERIDHNLRVDINWLRRLTGSEEETKALLEQLIFEGTLPVDMTMLQSKFNMRQFFQKPFFPLSLYYLGMLTFLDDYTLTFPNLTMKAIFTEYFNEVERIVVSDGYTPIFQRYLKDLDFSQVFAGYWETYVGQIPAQAFDKANENFFRTTFYEICTRYLARKYIFSIEVNYPTGRADFEAIGRPGTPFADKAIMIEFKHLTVEEGKRSGILKADAPFAEDVEQVTRYAGDLQKKYPRLTIERHLIYTVGAQHYRFFSLSE